jgi:hypothetical protein
MMRRVMRVAVVSLALASGGALVGVGAASAQTLSPWFHLGMISRPENLSQANAKDEVQEITTEPGAAWELKVGETSLGFFESEPAVRAFVKKATAANVQAALETVYGKGNVEVTGKGLNETPPLTITSVGEDADISITPVEAVNVGFGEAKASVVTPGSAAGSIVVQALNVGDATADGEVNGMTIMDRLPSGLHAVSVKANTANNEYYGPVDCKIESAREVQCTYAGTYEEVESTGSEIRRTIQPKIVPPYAQIEVVIGVSLEHASSGEVNEMSISGGGAPFALAKRPITVAGSADEQTPFGVQDYEQDFEEAGGAPDTQAGSHPFQSTTVLDLNETATREPAALAKDLTFKLPPGVIGNPTPFTRCTLAQFLTVAENNEEIECPDSSVVGIAEVTYLNNGVQKVAATPLYNLEPAPGEPARFAFDDGGVDVYLNTSVRTGEDYGVTVHVANIIQLVGFTANAVTFWGVPGDPRHNNLRGFNCIDETQSLFPEETLRDKDLQPCSATVATKPPPFLSLPTSCTGALQDSVEVDSWVEPTNKLTYASANDQAPLDGAMQALDGCGRLPFEAEIKVASDEETASTPSGLKVDVHVPQEETLNPSGLAPTELKKMTVALPEGVVLNPAAGDGLGACTLEEVGLHSDSEASCPNNSKLATATISTPLLPNPLKGFVYLASPQGFAGPLENPFGNLVAMYLVAKDPVSGVIVKLAGSVSLGPTGQITATFAGTPQLPFEDAEIEFFGGDRAPLATPALCRRPGEEGYVTHAYFEPWTNTETSHEVLEATSQFYITSSPGGGPCPNPPGVQSSDALPFAPSLSAETTSIQAGGYTPFTMTMSREDGNQNLQAIELHMPPGLSGTLSTVKLCGEAQADEGTCGPESLIGETIVSVGVGGDPFSVRGGKVYITGPYEGAPFGLSIVNPAKAGPFDLEDTQAKHPACDCLVVRAKIEVNPVTSALTITSDNSGPYKIPTIIEGIPLQIKHVNVTINRPNFTFNPTNCSKLAITGSLSSTAGATAALSVPFQVTNCAVLSFKPHVAVSTSGKTSRADGASLKVNLSYTAGPYDTNIAKFKIELPKQLPSRLSTLQKACTDATFEANPANCPAASKIGEAHATTPLIPVPLNGPMYFVSHGGAQFPEVIVVLQGYGVTIDLHGETFINKAGVTSSTFATVPDAPVGTFEANLPEGPDSALAANGTLCKSTLTMPTEIVAQNGAEFHQNTKIAVTGCKPALTIVHHKTKGKKATVVVSVPSAGKLLASAAGLSQTTTMASKAGVVTVEMTLSDNARALVAQHHGRRFAANIKLQFTPNQGRALTSSVVVLLG